MCECGVGYGHPDQVAAWADRYHDLPNDAEAMCDGLRAEIAALRKERDELRRTGQALSNLLNAGGRYVDGRGFKGPELTAFDEWVKSLGCEDDEEVLIYHWW